MHHPQTVFINTGRNLFQVDLPPAKEEVLPNVSWGDAAGFPTIAYWLYRVFQQRITGSTVKYKLGRSLLEETGACLLGGHGIPAANGLAAYQHMENKGAFNGRSYSEDQIYDWLSEPIAIEEKTFKYRFAKQKSKYLSCAIDRIISEEAPVESGKELRDWLLGIKGIGLKTASWIARNWLDADDVAILDIHIYRAGLLGGFFKDELTVEKNYLTLEEQFIQLAESMGVRTSELDAVMWYEMQQSEFVHELLSLRSYENISRKELPNSRSTNPQQTALL